MENITRAMAYAQIYKVFWGEDHRPWPIWEEFSDKSELCLIKRDEFIVTTDQVSTHAYFIVKGLVVAYRTLDDVKYVHWIRGEDDYVFTKEMPIGLALYPGFKNFKIERETLIAVEDTTAIRISHEDLLAIGEAHPVFKLRMDSYRVRQLKVFQELNGIMIMPLGERYRKMQKAVSFSLERVPDEYLASYLCMTGDQAKRLKKRLAVV